MSKNEYELHSTIDKSVNMIRVINDDQAYESRYVRRTDEYFISYISSQSACSQGCKMCHLTRSKQTIPRNASRQEMLRQARDCFNIYNQSVKLGEPRAKIVHFNFMARGEPLVNDDLDDDLLRSLSNIDKSLYPRHLISTIMPKTLDKHRTLLARFRDVQPEICYSIYSTNETFRKSWLPSALPVNDALSILREWQKFSGKMLKIHYALIKGENDSVENAYSIMEKIEEFRLNVNVNLIQYNPFDQTSEPANEETYKLIHSVMERGLPHSIVRIIPKVGFDVKASCGMFIEP